MPKPPGLFQPLSRRDFTLPQLFACLVVKDMLKRSYRSVEAVPRDSPSWLNDIGVTCAPDHTTPHRAAKFLLKELKVHRVMDVSVRLADEAGMPDLARHPLVVDSTTFDSRHVSRRYERRRDDTRRRGKKAKAGDKAKTAKKGRKSRRSKTVRGLPKLAIAIATKGHMICSMWTGTGMGADQPHFEPLVFDAWRRVSTRRFKVVGDAGYDSEPNHRIARSDLGLASLIPPESGRPRKDGGPPGGRWRRVMRRMPGTSESRKRCGYTSRWQAETGNSMIKRNQLTSTTAPAVAGAGTPVTAYTYDLDGNRLTTTNPDGNVILSTYDHDDRLTGQTWNNASGATTNTVGLFYDGDGRRTTAQDDSSSTTFAYDGDGRLTELGKYFYGNYKLVDVYQTFDANGNRLSLSANVNGIPDLSDAFSYDGLAAGRKKGSYYSAQYRRVAARRGRKRAILAVAHSQLVAAYHIIAGAEHHDLWADHFDKLAPDRLKRNLVARLEHMGYRVTVEAKPAA